MHVLLLNNEKIKYLRGHVWDQINSNTHYEQRDTDGTYYPRWFIVFSYLRILIRTNVRFRYIGLKNWVWEIGKLTLILVHLYILSVSQMPTLPWVKSPYGPVKLLL